MGAFLLYGLLLAVVVLVYAYLLAVRLDTSRHQRSKPFPSDGELLEKSEGWDAVDALDDAIRASTDRRYLVTGGHGQFGVYVVDLLWRRGERRITVLDVAPPPPTFAQREGIHWIKCDVSSLHEVESAFDEAKPDVVFALAAMIRYWERHAFTRKQSAAVNIHGTENVLKALQKVPGSEKILVYCSSAAVLLAPPLFMRLGWNFRGDFATYTVTDDEALQLPDDKRATHSYAVTKAMGDKLVRNNDGINGLRTGVLRPGMSICGPRDLLGGQFLRNEVNNTLCRNYVQNFVNSLDLAASFLLYEAALRERPAEVGGQAFLVTGDADLWSWDEIRSAVQEPKLPRSAHVSSLRPRPLIELYCFLRFYLLLPFSKAIYDCEPRPNPDWMEPMRLHHLMPASWNTIGLDVHVDDSRIRKVLGYRNKFSNAQTLRWVVESYDAAKRLEDKRLLHYEDGNLARVQSLDDEGNKEMRPRNGYKHVD